MKVLSQEERKDVLAIFGEMPGEMHEAGDNVRLVFDKGDNGYLPIAPAVNTRSKSYRDNHKRGKADRLAYDVRRAEGKAGLDPWEAKVSKAAPSVIREAYYSPPGDRDGIVGYQRGWDA